MFPKEVLPAFVAYKSPEWSSILVRSFRDFFPNTILLAIDNNEPSGNEMELLTHYSNVSYLSRTSKRERTHGDGIDAGLLWARNNNYRYITLLEPDCLITGTAWIDKLYAAVQSGAWMAGVHKKSYGPIHPAPSIWDLSVQWPSFCQQPRGSDSEHPAFTHLMDMDSLRESCASLYDEHTTRWFEIMWDTAQKSWFHAAAEGKATLVTPDDSFIHFWHGTTRKPQSGIHPLLDPYL